MRHMRIIPNPETGDDYLTSSVVAALQTVVEQDRQVVTITSGESLTGEGTLVMVEIAGVGANPGECNEYGNGPTLEIALRYALGAYFA